MSSERDDSIDILKGIGILLVILGHTYGPCTRFIYLFHMPLFFMCSGYCYNKKYCADLNGLFILLKRRIRSLWAPYFVGNTVFILLNNLFLKTNIYTNDIAFLSHPDRNAWGGVGEYYSLKTILTRIGNSFIFSGSTQLTGPTWFIETLFFSVLLYSMIRFVINKIIKTEKIQLVLRISIALAMIIGGYVIKDITLGSRYRMTTIIIVTGLIEMGVLLKRLTINKVSTISIILICVATCAALIILTHFGEIDLSQIIIKDPVFLIVTSLLGWILTFGVSVLIQRSHVDGIRELLIFYGKNTMPIIFIHLLLFKPVSFLQVNLYRLPKYMLASFPVLYNNYGWWIAYAVVSSTLCGVFILLNNRCFISIKTSIMKRKN